MLADAHVLCTHWDNSTETPYRFPEDCYPMLPAGKEEILKGIPPGWMTADELAWLSDQAAQRNRIVEVGSYLGRSTVVMGRSTTGVVFAVDDFKGVRDTQFNNYNKVPILSDTFQEFQKNVDSLPNVFWVRADHADTKAIDKRIKEPDMVFIDGSHEYPDVKRDITIWRERLAPGGLLCGHDASWPGVERALNELVPGWVKEAGDIWRVAC
jgi:SAM-dependent methyltransferase